MAAFIKTSSVFFMVLFLYYGTAIGMGRLLFNAPTWVWYSYFALTSVLIGVYTFFALNSVWGNLAAAICFAMGCYTLLTYPGHNWFDRWYDHTLGVANVAFVAAVVIHYLN